MTLGSDDGHIKSIASDEKAVGGDEQFVVTYVIDDEEVTISYTADGL